MDIVDLIAGVTGGIILGGAFWWCLRALDVKDGKDAPWWALGGAGLILLFLIAKVYTSIA